MKMNRLPAWIWTALCLFVL